MRLYADNDGNGTGDTLLATTTTDPDGRYSFADLVDGDYVIEIDESSFATSMAATTGPDSVGSATATVTVIDAAANLDVDFGYRLVGTASISGIICLEVTGATNGACDASATEPPVAGVMVTLYDSSATVVGTTVTDSSGAYSFIGLPDGTYTVSLGMTAPPLSLADTTSPAVTETATSAYGTAVLSGGATSLDLPFELVATIDLGDLPAPYRTSFINGAYHVIGTLQLGAQIDGELDATPSVSATGDDLSEIDDEDGIAFDAASWMPDALADDDDGSITATVAGGSGYLVGWVDWNSDGEFTGVDEMIVSQPVAAGATVMGFDIPDTTVLTTIRYARFRLFSEQPPLPELAYVGSANDGEVEDYAIEVPKIDVAKALVAGPTLRSDGTYSVTYHVTLANSGAATVHDVQVTDDLSAEFGTYQTGTLQEGEYQIDSIGIVSTNPAFLADPLALDAFTGTAPADGLFDVSAGGSLAIDESIVVEIVVIASGDAGAGCGAACAIDNSVSASGDLTVNNDGVVDGDATDSDGPVTFKLGSISGFTRVDSDASGSVDAALEGVTIRLYAALDLDLLFDDLIASTLTDAAGSFDFANLVAGSYRLVEVQPSGYTSLSESDGVLDDAIGVTVVAETLSSGHEFGEQPAPGVTPLLDVVKTADLTQAHVGDTVTYTFTITHGLFSDGTPITGLTVTDDITGTATLATQTGGDLDLNLETGETWTYTATYTVLPTDPDPLINTVTVEGLDSDGDTITATDTHTLPIVGVEPLLNVVKTANVTQAHIGDDVTYTFTITHGLFSDGTPISDLTVTDDVAGTATYVAGDTTPTSTSTPAKPGPTPPPTPCSPPTPTHSSTSSPLKASTVTATPSSTPTHTPSPSSSHQCSTSSKPLTSRKHTSVTTSPTPSPSPTDSSPTAPQSLAHRHRRHHRHSDTRHPNRRRPRPQPRLRRNLDLHRHLHRAPLRPRPTRQHRHRRRPRQ